MDGWMDGWMDTYIQLIYAMSPKWFHNFISPIISYVRISYFPSPCYMPYPSHPGFGHPKTRLFVTVSVVRDESCKLLQWIDAIVK
jgi:hypothetical protein